MSRLPEPEGLVETKEQLLKMRCPGCRMIFYWFEHHHPYCSAECSEVEEAAEILKRDHPEGLIEAVRRVQNEDDFRRAFMQGLMIEGKS